MAKPKKVSYRLIDPHGEEGTPMYAVLEELVEAHHQELQEAHIALAWCTSWKPDVDGNVTIGKFKRAGDLDRELSAYDIIILLSRSFWYDELTTDLQRRAVIDHELCHGAVKYDAGGEKVEDERGRIVYRTRRHDLEEFSEIPERYGCYKRNIEQFVRAVDRARHKADDSWVGFSTLQAELREAGLSMPLDVIVGWSDAERREARTWALLRHEQFPTMWRDAMPAFLGKTRTNDDAVAH